MFTYNINVIENILTEDAALKKKEKVNVKKEDIRVVPVLKAEKTRKTKSEDKNTPDKKNKGRVVKKNDENIVPIFSDPTLGWAVDFRA